MLGKGYVNQVESEKGTITPKVKHRMLFISKLKVIENVIDFLIYLSLSTFYLDSYPWTFSYSLSPYIRSFLQIY